MPDKKAKRRRRVRTTRLLHGGKESYDLADAIAVPGAAEHARGLPVRCALRQCALLVVT